LVVASERSFSRAAIKLYRTQPAVSQAIRRLEEQLGERLFDRPTKHATLTEAGSVLFREGTQLILGSLWSPTRNGQNDSRWYLRKAQSSPHR
jgi:DNA-binding transcriptional LysR family regulator